MAFTLEVPDTDEISDQVEQDIAVKNETKKAIENTVEQQAESVMKVNLDDLLERQEITQAIDSLGAKAYDLSSSENEMLEKRIVDLSQDPQSEEVSSTLEELAIKMKELDPTDLDFSKKGLFGKFSHSIRHYFEKYKTADAEIGAIIKSLDQSRKTLEADATTLEIEEVKLRRAAKELQKNIELGMQFDETLSRAIDQEKANNGDEDRIRFVEDEVLYPLRQKVMDFQQLQVVSQQGIIAMEVIRKNNKELIRSVDRAKTVTVTSLRTAVTVAGALYNQKIVLEKINVLNTATNDMITSTSKMLRSQGTAIQKQASETSVSPETLKNAFAEAIGALDDISRYRHEALPKMKETIDSFRSIADDGQKRLDMIAEENDRRQQMKNEFPL